MAITTADMVSLEIEYMQNLKMVRVDGIDTNNVRHAGVATGAKAVAFFDAIARRVRSALPDKPVTLKVDGSKIITDQT